MSSTAACRDMAARLCAYLDHEASAEELARVDTHLAHCEPCRAELRRSAAAVPALEHDVRALMTRGADAARQVRPHGVLTRPDRLHEPASTGSTHIARWTTVLVPALLALVWALGVGRGAVQPQPMQTGQPPAPSTASGPRAPVMLASVDGVVDPAVAAYISRVAAEAETQGASGLVLQVSSAAGLGPSLAAVEDTLGASPVPTRVVATGSDSAGIVNQLAQAVGTTPALPENGATQPVPMTLWESLWHRLLDPTTAYVLLVLGLSALSLELAHPGSLVPGAAGLLCLGLATLPLVTLPTNWLAVALLIVGVGLMTLEAHLGGHGLFVVAGGLALLSGSVLLFTPVGSLEPWLAPIGVAPAALVLGAAFGVSVGALLARLAHRTAALPTTRPIERLVGARGEARGELDPDGVVHVNGQLWSAHALGAPLARGDTVRVVARRGLILDVESAAYRPAATRKGAFR